MDWYKRVQQEGDLFQSLIAKKSNDLFLEVVVIVVVVPCQWWR